MLKTATGKLCTPELPNTANASEVSVRSSSSKENMLHETRPEGNYQEFLSKEKIKCAVFKILLSFVDIVSTTQLMCPRPRFSLVSVNKSFHRSHLSSGSS